MKRPLAGLVTALLVAGLAVPLVACADATGQRPGAGVKPPARFETAPRKANGSGIEVRYRVQPATAAGQTVRVTLVLDEVTDPTGASVRLAADGGLVLLQDGAPRALPAGRATTLEVDVTLQGTTAGYLSVFTTQHGMGSATSIRVPVGTAGDAPAPNPNLKTAPGGERLIAVPVR